jgi:hypothetical protein
MTAATSYTTLATIQSALSDAARLALAGFPAGSRGLTGTPASLGAAAAWIGGLLAVFIPLSVWRYRRMS